MKKWAVVAVVAVVIDEVLKWTALGHPEAVHKNFGIAFDIAVPSFVVIPIILAVIVVAGRSYFQHQHEPRIAVPLLFIMMGGLGNLFDRIVWGFIVDYLIIGRSAFNISDLMILGGVIALLITSRRKTNKAEEHKTVSSPQ